MYAYIVLYIVLYALFLLSKSLGGKLAFALAVISLWAFTSVRYGVGWDYWAYYDTIVEGDYTNILSRGEIATIGLVQLSRWFESPTFYFSVNAAMFYVLFHRFVVKYSVNRWISLFVFVGFPLLFLNSLSVVRNFTAIAIVLYSLEWLMRGKYIGFYLLVIAASCFHKTALLACLFPLVIMLRFRAFGWLIAIALAILISKSLVTLAQMVVGDLVPQYLVYLNADVLDGGRKAIYVLIFFATWAGLDCSIRKPDKTFRMFFDIYCFGVCLYVIFLPYGPVGNRLTLYATGLLVVIIPKCITSLRWSVGRGLATLTVHSAFCFFFFWTILSMSAAYIPYRTIFEIQQ